MELPDEYQDLVYGYLESLEQTVRELEKLVSRAAVDANGLDSLRELAHKLAGNGSSFGFPEITDCAKGVVSSAKAFAARSGTFESLERANSALVQACQDAINGR